MTPLRPTALCAAGILMGFTAGWFLKPVPMPGFAGQSTNGANRRAGPPTSLAGRPVGTAGETWLDAAAADAAAVRDAAQPGEVNQVLLEKLGAVLAMTDPEERLARWSELLPLMRMKDADVIQTMLREKYLKGCMFDRETAAFWWRCGRMDPATALVWAEEQGGVHSSLIGGWAYQDSAAALTWIKGNPGQVWMSGRGIFTELAGGMAARSPEEAVEFLLTNAEEPALAEHLGMAAGIVIQRNGVNAAGEWFRVLAESGAPAAFKSANLERLLTKEDGWYKGENTSSKMEVAQTVARYVHEPWFSRSAASDLGTYIGELDPAVGVGVMETFQNAEAQESFMDTFLGQLLFRDAASLNEWLSEHRASPSFDTMVFHLAKHLADEDPQAARNWAAQITDPAKREAMEKMLSGDQETAPDDASTGQ